MQTFEILALKEVTMQDGSSFNLNLVKKATSLAKKPIGMAYAKKQPEASESQNGINNSKRKSMVDPNESNQYTRLNDMDDSIRVTEFLSYRHNEIKVVCKF